MRILSGVLRSIGCALLLAGPIRIEAAVATSTHRIGGNEIVISVAPEKPIIVLGEPTWLIFRIENRGSTPFTFLPIWPEPGTGVPRVAQTSLIDVTRSDGIKPARTFIASGGGSGPGPRPVTLPPGGANEYRYFLPAWVEIKEPGAYQIRVRRQLQTEAGAIASGMASSGRIFDATAELRVEPADPVRLGQVIAAVKFKSDAALEILTYGLNFKMTDLPRLRQADSFSPELANSIRQQAASSLGQSRHPRAFQVLAAGYENQIGSVRIATVRAASRQPVDIAIPFLRARANDPDPMVREEAQQLIASMSQPGYRSPADPVVQPPVVRRGNELIVRVDARPADLARFKDEKGITSLSFVGGSSVPVFAYLTERDLATIAGWTDLQKIYLGPIPFTDEALTHLAKLPKLEPLPRGRWISDEAAAVHTRLLR